MLDGTKTRKWTNAKDILHILTKLFFFHFHTHILPKEVRIQRAYNINNTKHSLTLR